MAWNCQRGDDHDKKLQRFYDDPTRGLRAIKITREQAREAYYCRNCEAYMGCHTCAGDISDMICFKCKDWANDISESVRGPIVKNPDWQLKAMKIVRQRYTGELTEAEAQKAFADIFAV